MGGPIQRLARSAHVPLMALLLLAPLAAAAQEPTGEPSFRRTASAGLATGTLGFRLATFDIGVEVNTGALIGGRVLVGSRPEMLCTSQDLHPGCSERNGFAALLGGIQFAPSWKVVEPYTGVQVGFSRYDGPGGVSTELLAVPQVGLRLRLGSLGGVFGDASYLFARGGGFPFAGAGLSLNLRAL
jgi:hypothetical protein